MNQPARSRPEDLFRLVSENVTDFSIILLDCDGVVVSWTGGAQKIEGYAPEEILGEHFSVFFTEEDIAAGEPDRLIREAATVGHVETEGWRLRRNRDRYWANVVLTAARNEAGEITGYVRITRDLSERQRALQALEQSERYFRALIEHASDAVTIVNADGSVRYSSPAVERIVGYTPEERRGRLVFDVVHPADVATARALFQRVKEDPDLTPDAVMRARHRDGSWRHIHFRVRNLLADSAVAGVVINWRDITEQIRAEEKLKTREHFFRSIIERSSDILVVIDAGRVLRYVSPSVKTILGMDPDDLTGTAGIEFVHPDDQEKVDELLRELFTDSTQSASTVIRAHGGDFDYHVFDVRARNLLDDPLVAGIIIDARDVTESQRIEQALRESEARFRTIIETAAEGVAIRDAAGRLIFLNDRFAELFGYEADEMLGLSVFDLVTPEYRQALIDSGERRKRSGESEQVDLEFFRKDGSRFSAILSASPLYDADGEYIGALGMLTDITERKLLEDQLRQSQKIEAVGRLAGGIAHDFNNLLTAIRGHVDLLLAELDDSPIRGDIDEIRKAADRAAALTQQLLAFSRRQMLQPRVLDVDHVVGDMNTLLRRLIGEDIELRTHLNANGARIRADRGQIEQVLMNLAVNARDAMPKGGTLSIDTSVVEVSEDFVRVNAGAHTGAQVMLRVRDTGTGMNEETLSHVFEPFFTTKAVGQGTGLGLATVYGIVKQSGGYIRVISAPRAGTTFEILLPLVDEPVHNSREPAPAVTADAKGETVLVAEDEDSVRSLATRILRKRGYRVLEAKHGVQALEIARKHKGRIDLLLTDVVMPILGGRELGEQLLEMRPEIKVLFMSGYTGDALVQRGLSDRSSFLEKPFTPDSLALKVREILEAE